MRRFWLLIPAACVLACTGCGHKPAPPPTPTEVTEFQSALSDGDASIVDRLLSAKPGLVNVPDSSGKTPLKQAAEKGNQELADVIRRHGGHE